MLYKHTDQLYHELLQIVENLEMEDASLFLVGEIIAVMDARRQLELWKSDETKRDLNGILLTEAIESSLLFIRDNIVPAIELRKIRSENVQ
jgi:hypothetical protein